jgi:hypothetical protein
MAGRGPSTELRQSDRDVDGYPFLQRFLFRRVAKTRTSSWIARTGTRLAPRTGMGVLTQDSLKSHFA